MSNSADAHDPSARFAGTSPPAFVPCWRLPQAHRALLAAGLRGKMELQPGYRTVLRLATSRLVDSTRGPRPGSTAQHI
jgi:fatty acid desaturase